MVDFRNIAKITSFFQKYAWKVKVGAAAQRLYERPQSLSEANRKCFLSNANCKTVWGQEENEMRRSASQFFSESQLCLGFANIGFCKSALFMLN